MLGQNEFDIKIDNSNYKIGEFVRVIAGPLIGLKGNLVSIKNRRTLVVQLAQINLNILVEIPSSHIEKEKKLNS